MFAPTVIRMPTVPAVEQIVRSSCDAPSRWKKRRSIDSPWTMPIVPAYEYGRIACGPSAERIALEPRRDRRRAPRPTRCARTSPDPLGPTRRSGVVSRSAWYVRSMYRFTFAQRNPCGERMVRVARDASPPARARPSRASRTCRDSRAGTRRARRRCREAGRWDRGRANWPCRPGGGARGPVGTSFIVPTRGVSSHPECVCEALRGPELASGPAMTEITLLPRPAFRREIRSNVEAPQPVARWLDSTTGCRSIRPDYTPGIAACVLGRQYQAGSAPSPGDVS